MGCFRFVYLYLHLLYLVKILLSNMIYVLLSPPSLVWLFYSFVIQLGYCLFRLGSPQIFVYLIIHLFILQWHIYTYIQWNIT